MMRFSPISYYFVFPQLVRFMKDENKLKKPMDLFYMESLHNLKIRKSFIFHSEEYYSDIFAIFQKNIEDYMYEVLFNEKIDLNIYLTYLKDLNINYYNKYHNEIFYIPKDHVKNLYHMISKTRTQDLLKLNWLLKVGFTIESQKYII